MARMSKSDEGMAAREGLLANDPEVAKEVGNLMGVEVEPEVAAAPAPEEPTQPVPEATAEPVAPDTTDWKAEHEKLKAELETERRERLTEREGQITRLATLRRERLAAKQTPLTQAQTTTAQTQGIALKWNDKGEAFIDPASLAELRGGDDLERRIEDRVNERLAPYEQERMRNAIIGDDGARLTPILGEMDFAYRFLDATVQADRMELADIGLEQKPFQNVKEAARFIEESGIAERFRARFPHIAPDSESLVDFLTATSRPSVETVRPYIQKVADRKSPARASASAPAAAPAFDPPPTPLDPSKPRPHADRGGKAPPNEGNSMERELSDLSEKAQKHGAWSLTDTDRDRLGWLTKTLTKRKAS